MRKVLVTGGRGQLGSRLAEHAGGNAAMVFAVDRSACDITDPQSIARTLDAFEPHAVINAAAYTAVDRAESEPDLAHAINAIGPELLALACAERGIDFVHISTDYVFSGTSQQPYSPEDPTAPQGVYAASKLRGEEAVKQAFASAATAARYWIIRVAWLYDVRGSNFLQTMLRLGNAGKDLKVVDDQVGAPTAARPFAECLMALVTMVTPPKSGIWHYSTLGPTTWYGFADAIFKAQELDVDLSPCTTDEFPTPAKRPAFSYLDGGPLANAMGRAQVPWDLELKNELNRKE